MNNDASSFPLTTVIFFSIVCVLVALMLHWPKSSIPLTEEYNFPTPAGGRLLMKYVTDDGETTLKLIHFKNSTKQWEKSFKNSIKLVYTHQSFYAQNTASTIVLEDRIIFLLTTQKNKEAANSAPQQSLRQTMLSIRLSDGRIIWKKHLPVSVSQPWFYSRVSGKQLLVNTTPVFDAPNLHSISIATGKTNWSIPSASEPAAVLFHKKWIVMHELSTQRAIVVNSHNGKQHYLPIASIGIVSNGQLYHVMPQQSARGPWRLGSYSFDTHQTQSLFELPLLRLKNNEEGAAPLSTPLMMYNDSIIYPFFNPAVHSAPNKGLIAVHRNTGNILWKKSFPNGWDLAREMAFCGTNQFWDRPAQIISVHCMELMLNHPNHTEFSKLSVPYVPVLMGSQPLGPSAKKSRYDIWDMRNGEISDSLSIPKANSSMARLAQNYVVAINADDTTLDVHFFLISGNSGKFTKYKRMANGIENEIQGTSPFYKFIHHFEDIKNWDTDISIINQQREQLLLQ